MSRRVSGVALRRNEGGIIAILRAVCCDCGRVLPLPPPGAKPQVRIVLAGRPRVDAIATGSCSWKQHLEHDTIAATATVLREISAGANASLASSSEDGDTKFDVQLGPRRCVAFHLFVFVRSRGTQISDVFRETQHGGTLRSRRLLRQSLPNKDCFMRTTAHGVCLPLYGIKHTPRAAPVSAAAPRRESGIGGIIQGAQLPGR